MKKMTQTCIWSRYLGAGLWRMWLAAVLLLAVTTASAQVVTATLNGTVTDETGAVIPGATITVTNQQTRAERKTVSNGVGNFTLAALPAGDYSLKASAKGFATFQQTGIHLDPGDTRTDSGVKLKIGAESVTVTVNAGDSVVMSNGERSTLITEEDIRHLATEGRGVDELLKILPGSANATASLNSGASNSTYDPGQVTVAGATSSFSMSGSPTNGVTVREDGANLDDPGSYNASTQTVNINMTAEVKVETSNFGADVANGPVVVTAVSKSGGQEYHGQIYASGRAYMFNATDALARSLNQPKPDDRYIYPGAQIGGPIRFPWTDFNHNKKLMFWVGAEDMIQRNVYAYGNAANAIQHALVPTANMRKGNFSSTEIAKYLPSGALSGANSNTGCPTLDTTNYSAYANVCYVPEIDINSGTITNGQIPSGKIDSGAQLILNSMPLPNYPNVTSPQTGVDGFNYVNNNLVNNDLYQLHAKVELAQSDKDHFSVAYGLQRGLAGVPQSPYYYASGDSGAVNFPGGSNSTVNSHTLSVNWTRVINGTKTNEAFVNGTFFVQNFKAANPKLSNSQLNGYPYTGPFANNTQQMPSLADYGYDGLPLGIFPDYTFAKNGIFARKWTPGAGDNFTWQFKNVTLKMGGQIERPKNNEVTIYFAGGSSGTNSWLWNYYVSSSFTTGTGAGTETYFNTCGPTAGSYCNGPGNLLASFLEGEVMTVYQYNVDPQINIYWWNPAAYATADWKVRKNLTVTVGGRLEHMGMWNDAHGVGVAVWDESTANSASSTSLPMPGFKWHAMNGSVPMSGVSSRFAFFEPRFGMSWDVAGNGRTVVRGGWGQYRYHDNWGDVSNTMLVPAGLRAMSVGTLGTTLAYVSSLKEPLSGGAAYNSSVNTVAYGLDPGDNDQPLTTSYSLTLERRVKWGSIVQVAYVGSQTSKILNDGSTEAITVDDVNAVPVGTFFKPDPNPSSSNYGITFSPWSLTSLSAAQLSDWRPYPNYESIQVLAHKLYANYNGLQTSWNKQKGRFTYGLNYTWSKTLGVHGGYINGTPGDSFNLRNDYGPLSYDRSHIVNATYWVDLGNPVHGNAVLKQVANSWQLSGITGWQSGPNMASIDYNSNFGLSGSITGVQGVGVSNEVLLGTTDVALQPRLVCNPRSGLASHQYINGNCFRLPVTVDSNGQVSFNLENGPFQFPYIHGPAMFNSDLNLMKDIKLSEKQTLEIRGAAFNFLNHPLYTFSSGFQSQYSLTYSSITTSELATAAPTNVNQFGYATHKIGRRVMEFYIKYNF
jgi:hypothetical protein